MTPRSLEPQRLVFEEPRQPFACSVSGPGPELPAVEAGATSRLAP